MRTGQLEFLGDPDGKRDEEAPRRFVGGMQFGFEDLIKRFVKLLLPGGVRSIDAAVLQVRTENEENGLNSW